MRGTAVAGKSLRPILAGADLALCHLESPLSMDDDDLSFRGTFRVPSSLADAIAGAGYDGCSLASNHALDSGPSTVESTLHHLRRVGLATAGMADHAEAAGPAWFDPGGIRVAHLSVTDLLNGRDLPTDPPWLVGHLDVDLVAADAAAAVDAGAGHPGAVLASTPYKAPFKAMTTTTTTTTTA